MTIAMILAEKGRDVVTALPDATLREAATRLMQHGVGALLVVNAQNDLLGLIAERDVVSAVAIGGAGALDEPIKNYMHPDPKPASEEDTVDTTMQIMTVERRRHLPVLRDGRLVGLVSIGDVVKYRIRVIEEEHRSMREYIAQA